MEESSSIRIGVQRPSSENVAPPQSSPIPRAAILIGQRALSSLQEDKDSLKEKADEVSHSAERFQEAVERYKAIKKEWMNAKEGVGSEPETEVLEKRYESTKSDLKDKIQDLKYRLQTFDLKARFTTAKEIGKELLDKVKNIRSENKFFQETKLDQPTKAEQKLGLPVKTKEGKDVEKLKDSITKNMDIFLKKDFLKTEEGLQSLDNLKGELEVLHKMHKETNDPRVRARIETILTPLVHQYNFRAEINGMPKF